MTDGMRVGLDITQAVKRKGRGIARYIRSVCPRLVRDVPDLEATFCIRGERWWKRSLVARMAPGVPRSWLPVAPWMSTRGLDLFHSFGNHLPAWSGVPRTFTVHDLRALDLPARGRRRGGRLARNIERADGIICLTGYGRDRLLEHYPDLDASRVAVVPHGVDHQVFYPRDPVLAMKAAASFGLGEPFLLQLGSWFPHKNLELSIRAFARSSALGNGYRMVFVGGGPRAHLQSLLRLAEAESVQDRIVWIEDAGDQDLPLLLSAASCLLQPSRYEGFALPLLEAMASGVPGVVSDSSCLPEVSGGLWPVTGPDDEDGFAAGMDRMCLDGAARSAAIRAGLERARGFTWKKTAEKTASFFRSVLGSKNSSG